MKKKHFSKVLCIILAIMLLLTAIPMLQTEASTDAAQLFVATDGDDSAAGTINAPLKTLEGARDRIREMKANGTYPAAGVVVNIRGGEYLRLGDTFRLEAQDSGTAEGPVVYRAYNNEKVVFSGGLEVDGSKFLPVTDEDILARLNADARDHVLVYDIGAENGITEFAPYPKNGRAWTAKTIAFDLMVDNELQTLSRYPNDSMLGVTQIVSSGFIPRNHVAVNGVCPECNTPAHTEEWMLEQEGGVFKTNNAYLNGKVDILEQESALWAFGYFGNTFAEDRCTVESMSQSGSLLTITLGEPSYYGIAGSPTFYLFNALCEVDSPGEYYLDRENAKLYYYPAKDLADSEVSFIMQPNALVYMDDVEYVKWENLSFANGNHNGIQMGNGSNVEVAGCTFNNLGKTAVAMTGTNLIVRSCNISNMGADGVAIKGGDMYSLTNSNNVITNCDISNVALRNRTNARGISMYGCGNSALRNRIYNCPEMAIFFRAVNTTIAGNEIFNVCTEASDTGAIYCGRALVENRGAIITNNYVHDIPGSVHGRSAVYLDDMVAGATVTNNLFVNIEDKVALIGGGRDNVYSNNILLNDGVGGYISYGDRGLDWGWAAFAAPNGQFITELNSLLNNPNFDEAAWREQFPEVFELDFEYYETHPQYGQPNSVTGEVFGEGYEKWYKNIATPENAVVTNNIAVGAVNPYSSIMQVVIDNGIVQDNESYDAGTDIGFTDAANGIYTVEEDSIIKELMGDEHFDANACGLYRDEYRTGLPGSLEVSLEASKNTYSADENVPILLTVTNPNSSLFKGIRTEIHLPSGLKLESGSLT